MPMTDLVTHESRLVEIAEMNAAPSNDMPLLNHAGRVAITFSLLATSLDATANSDENPDLGPISISTR